LVENPVIHVQQGSAISNVINSTINDDTELVDMDSPEN
jgi:hypothetical protein